jgi:hypothetical protein
MHEISFFAGELPQTPENIAGELSTDRALSSIASSPDAHTSVCCEELLNSMRIIAIKLRLVMPIDCIESKFSVSSGNDDLHTANNRILDA